MRTTFGESFLNGSRNIERVATELALAQQRVSSGRRIDRPREDPPGTAAAITEHAVLTRIDSYERATSAVSSRLAVVDSVLSDIIVQLTSAKTTAMSGRGTPPTQDQRNAAGVQLLAIRDALMSDINTEFRGTYLFSGAAATTVPYAIVSGGGISVYQGDSVDVSIDVADGRQVTVSYDGGAIFQGSDSQHVLAVLTDLAAAVVAGDGTAIGQGIAAIDRAFERATLAQTHNGNSLRAIEEIEGQLGTARLAATARTSKLEDANMAEAIADMSKADTAYRAALGAFATTGRLTLMDYLR